MAESELPEGTPTRVEVDGASILLHRQGGRILGIGAICTHAGGPLEEGKILDEEAPCVECPWHQSVFRLEDGAIVHGPASVPATAYDARVQQGKIEVRARS
jgi:nitrite reductase/ring-hydroxylating ferredoxin subunit